MPRRPGVCTTSTPPSLPHRNTQRPQVHLFYLGPHAPHLTPKEIDLLHSMWLELSNDVAPEELHHHDVVHFSLEELRGEIDNAHREEVLAKLRQHLREIKNQRITA